MAHMKATFVSAVFAALVTLLTQIAVVAGEVIAGREKAAPCAVCHGNNGIAIRPDAPNIAGQNAFYLRAQLLAYRTGRRVHPQMNIIAQGLSDDDIDDLVAWYSSIKLIIELPD